MLINQLTRLLRLHRQVKYHSKTYSMYVASKKLDLHNNVRVVDLRSDTVSKPSPQMRKAIFEADVGDDVFGEDPTVAALEKKAAEMLGKESALYVASGTMSNLIAILSHCQQRGAEIITGDQSHTFLYEQGGPAQLGGIHTLTLPNKPDGTFDIDAMATHIRPDDCHYPITSLICVENTHNMCGGKVLPQEWLDKLGEKAKCLGIPLHMDGARLFNAAVYSNVPASRIVRDCSSVSICLSKGLGAPVGSVLVGSCDFIKRARRVRKVMGGGMRQAGIIAAAGVYALENMVNRLEDDHKRTAAVGKAIVDMKSKVIWVDYENLHTNILMVHLDATVLTAQQLTERLMTVSEDESTKFGDKAAIVKISPKSEDVARLVVYCDITDADIEALICKLKFINAEYC